jgi:hypothetical protein
MERQERQYIFYGETMYSYGETGGQCIPMEQGCPEGVAPPGKFCWEKYKGKIEPPSNFGDFQS